MGRWLAPSRPVLFLLLTALGASSCGNSETSEPIRNTTIKVPPAWSEYRPGLRLSPLMAVGAQLGVDVHTIENAAQILAIGCMQKRGFDYQPKVDEVKPRDPLALGDLDPRTTSKTGYTISAHADGGLTEADYNALPAVRYEASLSKADATRYNTSLLGRDGPGVAAPTEGCIRWGRRRVVGPTVSKRWQETTDAIDEQTAVVDEQLRASKKWAAANRRWATCMARRGFDYPSPDDAVNDAYERFNVEHRKTATKAERALATADAKCRREVNFVRLSIEISEPFERKALTRIEPKVLAWMAERDRVLAHVETELARAGR